MQKGLGAMGKRILLVEDTATMIMLEKMLLAGEGFEITTAGNGVEGLKKIEASAPDLVLLDIMMPEMDGIEMCRQLKNNPETAEIPVIMVTTQGEPERVEQAFEAGCDDFVTKPIDKIELLEKIRSFLK